MKGKRIINILLILILIFVLAGCTVPFHLKTKEVASASKREDLYVEKTLPKTVRPEIENTRVAQVNGVNVIMNPANVAALVNKTHMLPEDYHPKDLVAPNVPFSFDEDLEKRYLREEAARAVEEMFASAKKDGINLVASSGYRSYERQNMLFQAKANSVGEQLANQVVAFPGESEHQTGLALDITSAGMGFKLEETFGETKEGIWLKNNAHHFGFIIRYPKGKESITGYKYEPWHVRYVGKELAQILFEEKKTLDEFLLEQGEVIQVDQIKGEDNIKS